MLVRWRADEIIEKARTAALEAIDETTKEAAEEAQGTHWWQNRPGARLEHETISEPAKIVDGKPTGRFGTTQRRGFYGLFLEIKQPFLRPAADRTFPRLASRIKDRMD